MSWRRAVLVAGILAFCLGVVVTRVFWDGRGALREGDAAMARGDTREAIGRWRRAARWYAPGAPHVAKAYARLTGLARASDHELALEAWRAVRSSILSTRSFYTPYAELLPEANENIATLMAASEGPQADPGKSETERRAWHLALLSRDEAPSVFWTIVALLGLAAWVGGGFLFAWRGITADEKLAPRPAVQAALLVAVGLLVWMLGLYKA